MERVYVELGTPFGRAGSVLRYGHWGRPVIVFPSEYGRAWEAEDKGMIAALARREIAYQDWIIGTVCEWIGTDSSGADSALVMGASLGAYRALAIALRRADLFPDVLGLSGCYDPTQWRAWGEPGPTAYATNPTWFVPDLSGDHLEWLRGGEGRDHRVRRGAAGRPRCVGPRRGSRLAVVAAPGGPPHAAVLLTVFLTTEGRFVDTRVCGGSARVLTCAL